MHGTVGWFQVGTDAPDEAKRFYGDLFGWTFAPDPNAPGYDLVTTPGANGPSGGVADTRGETPNHAIFFVIVDDVAKAVAETERLGGKTVIPTVKTPSGLVFAHVADPSGNEFGVFTPAPSS